jgi:hypothetical protein
MTWPQFEIHSEEKNAAWLKSNNRMQITLELKIIET